MMLDSGRNVDDLVRKTEYSVKKTGDPVRKT
jgi:hypothetical protein